MKILQFPIADSFGGITHYVLDQWKWINKEKFQFDFATMSKKLDFADQILSSGSKIHYISCYAEEDSRQFAREIHGILDEGYDAVHLHTKQWKSFLIEKICLERKIPKIIVHSHSTQCDANDADVRRKEIEKHEQVKKAFNSSLATDFWACSDAAADWLFGNQIPREKVQIMRNAIDVEKFSYQEKIRREIRRKLGVEEQFVLGNVGRMVYQKNHRFLLQVFAQVCRINENAVLILAGDGPLEQELSVMAGNLGIRERVRFLGKRTDVHDLYQAMDVFVFPSHFEGLSIALLEAQTCGLKCITGKNIPSDVNVTGEVTYLDQDVAAWVANIQRFAKGYRRIDQSDAVRQAGYSIKQQILNVEAGYLG
ncbi:MAG: glycosyltransferase family 1 protein [Eubacterium sp.]|nr:glycosyltransferase family 1 protein [Eubacterium sp.]